MSCFLLLTCAVAAGQSFQYDNVKYRTVFPDDLCQELKGKKDYLLLDVRSAGEYHDSSSSVHYNLGRFKGAAHIPINELPERWKEIASYKDLPVYIYCSHSQRSRRAAVLLADSGFSQVSNINGGMTQVLKRYPLLPDCYNGLYSSNNPYQLISPARLIGMSRKSNPWFIVDIRDDSAFLGISRYEKRNALGKFEGAQNIAFSQLEAMLGKIPADKKVLVVDESGTESPLAATLLKNLGLEEVYVLAGGMESWVEHMVANENKSQLKWISTRNYRLIGGDQLHEWLTKKMPVTLIDIRKAEQFRNQSKNSWENIGHIQQAMNFPFPADNPWENLRASKTDPIVLYTFTNQHDVFEAARSLADRGFQQVSVLTGGIWILRWTAFNVKGKSHLGQWVVDIPEENR